MPSLEVMGAALSYSRLPGEKGTSQPLLALDRLLEIVFSSFRVVLGTYKVMGIAVSLGAGRNWRPGAPDLQRGSEGT